MPNKINILKQMASAGLVGRGGASFPTAQKWAAVSDALKARERGYIIINGAEGEPGVRKDGYLLDKHPAEVIDGIDIADSFFGRKKIKKIYFFISHEYYGKYAAGIKKTLAAKKYQAIAKKFEFFVKREGLSYVCGEETALLNIIEGKRIKPRLKPPYPTSSGLHGCPTLINNTETFYNISLLANGKYDEERLYTINGAIKRPGVYRLPIGLPIKEILERTGNWPSVHFFVQTGGEASGLVLNSDQLDHAAGGAGSVMVYDAEKTDRRKLLKRWLNFYRAESCGQCAPCREGTFRLWEIINRKAIDYKLFWEIVSSLEESSFCGLGSSLPIPLKSYFENIVRDK